MKRDLCTVALFRMRGEVCRMNGVKHFGYTLDFLDHLPEGYRHEYEKMRLELAKKVCMTRAAFFANNRRACQRVLNTIDKLFLAKG